MRNWYAVGDRKLKALIVAITRIFKKSRLTLNFDQINQPVRTIQAESKRVYKLLNEKNRDAFLDLGFWVYMEAYAEVQLNIPESENLQKAKKEISGKWLDGIQSEYNPVTKYVYVTEAERKRARFFESLVADAESKQRREMENDYRAAENAWIRQTRQAMIDIEDRAAIAAYKDAGVRKARWNSQKDGKVCKECGRLDGMIFPIDAVPDKPHRNCRCTIEPVTEE
uniref:Putative head morphogenesis protein n=1 Tax=Siphoviridae sp. ctrvp54 TaxID=2825690 RepID=A0A8S5P814_9CAUD|nr:MAG TPA: putative head morphogenesis protein [Siphoviridae sp. ctrvp54]